MSLNQWVVLKHSYPIRSRDGTIVRTVPAEQLGRITEVDEDGSIYVAFPQAHINVRVADLLPAPHPEVGQALNLLREFRGHHCDKDGQYQFNIKLHHFPPQEIFDKCGDEETWDEYHEILRNDLRSFMDESYGIVELIDWVDKRWWTAGRSGGWLVIEDIHDRDWERLKDDYEGNSEELEAKQQTQADKDYVRECREGAYKDIMELAFGVRYIGECVRIAKQQTGEFVEDVKAYGPLLERCAEEEDDEEEVQSDDGTDDDGDDGEVGIAEEDTVLVTG